MITALFNVGYGDITPVTIGEVVLMITWEFVATVYYSIMIANI